MSPTAVWFIARPELGRVSQRWHKTDQETLPDFIVIATVTDLCDSILHFFLILQIIYFSKFSFLIFILAKAYLEKIYIIREHLSKFVALQPTKTGGVF